MGGPGSGNWYRWNKKTTTDEVKRIDIRYMKKQGLLKPNTAGTLNWSVRGEPSGSISYSCFTDYLRLNFKHRDQDGAWKPIEQHIRFDRTPCHFGGERLWFRCPHCGKRVGLLYAAGKLFLCRHCYQLPYSSQNSGYTDNLIEQKHKLGERIFQHYEFGEGWGKKKGIHWSTFKRLHIRYIALEEAWCKAMAKRFPEFTDFDI